MSEQHAASVRPATEETTPQHPTRTRILAYLPVAGVALVGLVVSVMLFTVTLRSAERRVEADFHRVADERIAGIERNVATRLTVLDATRAFFDASQRVNQGEFAAFASRLLDGQPGVRSLRWVRYVRAKELGALVTSAREDGIGAFTIREHRADGTLGQAQPRAEYFPVYYEEPSASTGRSIGYDLGRDPIYAAVFGPASVSGNALATGRLNFGSADQPEYGVAVVLPRYGSGTTRRGLDNVTGFLVGVLDVGEVVQSALSYLAPEAIDIVVEEEMRLGDRVVLATSVAARSGGGATPTPAKPNLSSSLRRDTRVNVAGRTWRITAVPAAGFESGTGSALAWGTLGGGVLITLLFCGYLLLLLDRNARVQKLVEFHTREAIESVKIAERAAAAKSDFLANMSHEIRTPMNAVIGMTGLLMDTQLDAQQAGFARIIQTSGELLLTLINDILDFSKIEAGKIEFEAVPFDLRSSIEDVVCLVADRAEQAGVELILRFEPDTPSYVLGDPGRIRQILLNLIGNAVKFTPRGEILVTVAAGKIQDGDLADFQFSVKDSGIGIPSNRLDEVFGKFTQADQSTTRKYGGTGLGLAISKQLTELMGGRIGVTSVQGKGSTFWFMIPLKVTARPVQAPIGVENLNSVRVLCVDDNATNLLVMREQLANYGVRCETLTSAKTMLATLHTAISNGDPFRVVVLDFQMPDLDGESAGRMIKADPVLKDTELMMLTSVGFRGDVQRLSKAGFSGYLVKPVRESDFAGALRMVLSAPAGSGPIEMITSYRVEEAGRATVAPTIDLDSKRILLVEDNAVNQKVASLILQKMGCRVDVAANGEEAVTMYGQLPYDAVLMDVQMPVMNGLEATQAIRRKEGQGRRTPIIAMTANALEEDRERCLSAGMDDYVPKPVRKEVLASTLRQWIGQASSGAGNGASTVPPVAPPARPVRGADLGPGTRARTNVLVAGAHPTPEQHQQPHVAPDPVDLAALRVSAGDSASTDMSDMIIQAFLDNADERQQALDDGAARRDWSALTMAAHTLKSTAQLLEAKRLTDLCSTLETAAGDGDTPAALGLLDPVRDELRAVVEFLRHARSTV
jgi:signal transduction histidine kinase/CheY-like chemotaxis protein/HPt (histidine-containing phosphotransfer) domain-containing protein